MSAETDHGFTACGSSSSVTKEHDQARDIHVWNVDLSQIGANHSALQAVLSADEAARAERFAVAGARLQFIAGRACLRTVLAAYLRLPEPSALRFVYGIHGKPALADRDDVHFNVSHSAERAVIVLSSVAPVGVDVEQERNDISYDSLVDEHFCVEELTRFRATAVQHRRELFFDYWTRKEAVAKGLGVGLTIPLDEIRLDPTDDSRVFRARVEGRKECWFTYSIDVGDVYAGALATTSQSGRVVVREWQWPAVR